MSDGGAVRVTHVLYLSEWPGQNAVSGAEKHVLTLLPALAARGVDVELIAMLWGGERLTTIDARLRELESAGVRVTKVRPAPGRRGLRRRAAFARAWTDLARLLHARPGRVVHVHLDLRVTPVIARLAGRGPVVLSIHNDEPFYGEAAWKLWLRLLDGMVDRYIGITGHVSAYYRGCAAIAPEKIDTIHYGVARPPASPLRRSTYGIAPDEFVLGYVGRLSAQKNLATFVRAMKALPGVTGLLVGDGPDRSALESLAAEEGIRNVRFLGSIPDASRVMPLFDLFCLPSLWEGLGLVLIEAMLQRVPVIGSRRGAIPEVLGNGVHGDLFEPTVEGIVAAVTAVRRDYSTAVARAARAAAYAEASFGIDRMASSTVETYIRASRESNGRR